MTCVIFDIIIQEYIQYPNECGIFYVRKPLDANGHVVSIGLKKQFILKGDGRSTIREILRREPRYRLQIERLESIDGDFPSWTKRFNKISVSRTL